MSLRPAEGGDVAGAEDCLHDRQEIGSGNARGCEDHYTVATDPFNESGELGLNSS